MSDGTSAADGASPQALARDESLDVTAIAQRLASLPEPSMRAAILAERLTEMDSEQGAWLLDALSSIGRTGGPPFDVGLLAAVEVFSRELLPYAVQRRLHEAADALGLSACKDLLLSPDLGDADGDANAPRSLIPGGRPLTLGERKSLARSWRRDVIERLVLDPAPDVVAQLLDNPHLTETDVLRIATSRRATAPVLSLVFAHRRWNTRERVRVALIRNPRLPTATALRLVGLLGGPDRRRLLADGHLPEPVRDAIRRRLRRDG